MAIKLILKSLLRFVFKSLLIPWIVENMDKWTTILNKKLVKLMEKE